MSDGDQGFPLWLKGLALGVTWVVGFAVGLITEDFIPKSIQVWTAFKEENPEYYYSGDYKPTRDSEQALTVRTPEAWQNEYPGERLTIGPAGTTGLADLGPAIGIYNATSDRWWSTWGEESGFFFGASKTLLMVTHDEINEGGVTNDEIASAVERPEDEATDEEIIFSISGNTSRCREQLSMKPYRRNDGAYTIKRITWVGCSTGGPTSTNQAYTVFVARPSDRQTAQENGEDFVAVGSATLVHEGDWIALEEFYDSFEVDPDRIPEPSEEELEEA